MRTVTILLTKYAGWFGRFICAISKHHYSHASISIDEEEEIFYSFNMKGFVIEKPKRRRPKTRRFGSVCIRMPVPESTYFAIQEGKRGEKHEENHHDHCIDRSDYWYTITAACLPEDRFE